MTDHARRILVAICGVLSVAAIVLGTIYTYTARTLFNPDVFATRVADGLADPRMASLVASQLANEVIAVREDLIAYRPLIVGSLERVVGSVPFRAVVRRAVRRTHATIFSKKGEQIALTVGDLSVVARDALAMYPQIASKVPPEALEALGATKHWTPGKTLGRVMNVASRMRTRALILLGIGFGTGILGFSVARRKDLFLLRCGIAMAVTALVVGVAAEFGAPVLASIVKPRFASDLVRGLWPAFVTPLALRMWILGGMGLTVVAGVTSTFRRVNIGASGAAIWHVIAGRPHNVWMGLLRGAFLAVVGGLSAFHPNFLIDTAVVIAAGLLFFFGIQEIFSIILDWLPRIEAAVEDAKSKKGSAWPRIVIASVMGLAAIGGGVWWMVHANAKAPMATVEYMACNGHPELCDRPLNEVAFATSHNSMSGADIVDWMFPNQNKGIPGQLEDGVRGFLIDVHYGVPVGERIKTILDDEVNSMAKYEEALGKEAVTAAMRMRDRMVGQPTGDKDVYLGHGFCELGATRFVDALKEMNEFLVMHPDEVVIIVVQDEGVSPADVASCFERSGMINLVYKGPAQKPWPTLREMVESDQRVVVMAENHWEGVPWYHGAFEVCQETPYKFEKPEDMSNQPGRGDTAGSLLLMNNWIETTPAPLPSNAAIVNSYDILLKRARACKKERGMMPNLIAVDFYKTGDLMRVVDAMNGVEQPQTAAVTPK
jgi:hypothetical protein